MPKWLRITAESVVENLALRAVILISNLNHIFLENFAPGNVIFIVKILVHRGDMTDVLAGTKTLARGHTNFACIDGRRFL